MIVVKILTDQNLKHVMEISLIQEPLLQLGWTWNLELIASFHFYLILMYF